MLPLPLGLALGLVLVLVLMPVLLLETARLRRWCSGTHWSGRHLLCLSGPPRGSQLLVLPQVLGARLCVLGATLCVLGARMCVVCLLLARGGTLRVVCLCMPGVTLCALCLCVLGLHLHQVFPL